MIKHITLILLAFTCFIAACGESPPEPTPTPQLTTEEQLGRDIFAKQCGACHSLAEDTVVVGPSMAGIASRAATQVDEQDAYTYILTSVLKPDVFLVEGFENLMPSTFGKTLTGEELDATIAFLLTLE